MSLLNKLAAFWTFEEAGTPSIDVAGRGNDLDWTGDVSRVTGVIGNGVRTNGPGAYISTNTTSDVAPAADDAFTIGFWTKPDGGQPGSSRSFAGIYGSYEVGAYFNGSKWAFQFVCSRAGGTAIATTPYAYDFDSATWFYVRAWRDTDSDTVNIQVDCGTIYSAAFNYDLSTNSNIFYVGSAPVSSYWGVFTPSYGAIDALGIWKRVLDTGEASDLCDGTEYPFGICSTIIYGDYEFANTFHPADDSLEWASAVGKLPRAHGGRALDFYLQPRRLLVRGGEIKGPFNGSALRARVDAIRAALGAAPQSLQFDPDRYWREVRCEYFRNPYGPTHYCRMAAEMEISFLARDPFQYAQMASSASFISTVNGGTETITAGGNIHAKPIITFTVGGAGSQTIDWSLENTTTGETFSLAGDVTGGQAIVVDCLDMTVRIGTTDETALFDGVFPRLEYGDNTWTLTVTSGTITSIAFAWRNRWW